MLRASERDKNLWCACNRNTSSASARSSMLWGLPYDRLGRTRSSGQSSVDSVGFSSVFLIAIGKFGRFVKMLKCVGKDPRQGG